MKTEKGFSLLELLLAATIFSVIAVVLISTFNAGVKILRRSEVAMRYHQQLRFAMDEVSLDLHNALLAEVESEEEVPELEGEEESIHYFKGDGKSFEFITLKDRFEKGSVKREVSRSKYFLASGKDPKFMRAIGGEDSGEELLSGVITSMNVTYSYEPSDEGQPPEWYDYWDQEEAIPKGVKISFGLKGLGPVTQFTKTIYIDTGVLGSLEDSEGSI